MSNPEFPSHDENPQRFVDMHYSEGPQLPDFGNPEAIKGWQVNMLGHAMLVDEVDMLQGDTHDENGKPLDLEEIKAKYPTSEHEGTADEAVSSAEESNVRHVDFGSSSEAVPTASDSEDAGLQDASSQAEGGATVTSLDAWKARKGVEDAFQSEPDVPAPDRYDGLHYDETPRHPSYPPPEAYADPERMDEFRHAVAEHETQVANQQALREEIDSLQADTHDQYRRPLPLGEIKSKFAYREFKETMNEVGEIQRSVIDQENLKRAEQGQESLRGDESSDFIATAINDGRIPRVVGGDTILGTHSTVVSFEGHVPTKAEAGSQVEAAPDFSQIRETAVRLTNTESLPEAGSERASSEGFGINTFTVPRREEDAGRLTEDQWKARTGTVKAAIEATGEAPAATAE